MTKDFTSAKKIIEAATKGPWYAETFDYESVDEMAGRLRERLLHSPKLTLTFVRADHPKEVEVALTGNGPTSEANAAFFTAARTGWPEALDALEALRGELLLEREKRILADEEFACLRVEYEALERLARGVSDSAAAVIKSGEPNDPRYCQAVTNTVYVSFDAMKALRAHLSKARAR